MSKYTTLLIPTIPNKMYSGKFNRIFSKAFPNKLINNTLTTIHTMEHAEVKALATGNPYIKEKMDLDIQVSKLKLMKANHTSQRYRLEDNITQHYPQQIARLSERIEGFKADIAQYEAKKPADKELIGCGVYLLSPLTYIIIYSLAVWKETVFKLYEMKMVCRYNLQLLSTFRMLYFSIINLVLNSTMLLIMQAAGISEIVLGKLLGISFAAIFLYGIVMLFLRWKKKTVVSQLI